MPAGDNNNNPGSFRHLTLQANIYTVGSTTNATLLQQGQRKAQSLPYNFRYTGRTYNGVLEYEASNALWWSRSLVNANGAYNLYLSASSVMPTDSNSRYLGFSLRCITTPTS